MSYKPLQIAKYIGNAFVDTMKDTSTLIKALSDKVLQPQSTNAGDLELALVGAQSGDRSMPSSSHDEVNYLDSHILYSKKLKTGKGGGHLHTPSNSVRVGNKTANLNNNYKGLPVADYVMQVTGASRKAVAKALKGHK